MLPCLTVVRKHVRVRGWDVILTHNPLPLASLYRGVLHHWAEEKSACLEAWGCNKLSGEGKQLQKGKVKGFREKIVFDTNSYDEKVDIFTD